MMITHSPKLCVIATFVILALAQGGSAFAQAKLTTLGADAQLMRRELTIGQTARSSPSLTAFRKTPLFVRRQALFAQTWTNPKTTVKYADNHSLNITMIKNPSVADGATHVTKKMKVVGTEPCKDHSDWTCATQEINLTADSSSFLNNDYGNSNSHIYPGAIFTFDNFYHGQYHEQAGERNPMTLVTDNPNINGSAGVVIENPSILTCRDAVATIYHRFTKDVGTESSAFDVLESSNSADLNMQISGGASGYGLSFSDAFGSDSSSSSVSLTIDARKSLYSISALPSEGGFFKDASIENTPNLMVVSNVVYGVRVLANLTVTFNSTKDANDFKAAYSGFGASANAAFTYLNAHKSSQSAIHGYIVGGPGNSVVAFDKNSLEAEVNAIMAGVTYQNARPISYQFMDMAGDMVGATSATDTFRVVQCAPSSGSPKITSVRVSFQQGADGKNDDTPFAVFLYPGDQPILKPIEYYGSYFGYSAGEPSARFEDNGKADIYLTTKSSGNTMGVYDRNTFIKKNGGHLHLHIYPSGGVFHPHGQDTWQVSRMDLIINFADGTSQDIKYPPFTVNEDSREADFYFDGTYARKG